MQLAICWMASCVQADLKVDPRPESCQRLSQDEPWITPYPRKNGPQAQLPHQGMPPLAPPVSWTNHRTGARVAGPSLRFIGPFPFVTRNSD